MGAEDSIGIVCVSASFALSGLSHSGCCCDGVLGRSGTSTRSTDLGCKAAALQINVIAQRMAVFAIVHFVHAAVHAAVQFVYSDCVVTADPNDPYAQPAQLFVSLSSSYLA